MCECVTTNGQTYGLEFRHVGQVEGYVGQGHRSKVKVTRSKKNVSMDCLLEIIDDFTDGVAEESTHYFAVVNTATWGVSKAYAFFP